MFSRNQNKPPRSPNASNNGGGKDSALNKRNRVGMAKAAGPASSVRKRQAFTDVNSRPEAIAGADAASLEGSESAPVEFTKEEVEALLSYKPKIKKFDHKANADMMSEHNKRLRLCVKWFQNVEEAHLVEQQGLRAALESSEKQCAETEAQMAKSLEELDRVICGIRNENMSLQEQLAKEVSEKLEAMECQLKEKEGRIATEKSLASILEDLEKCKQDLLAANNQIVSQEDKSKKLQEYNTSLQQYNSKLQTDLSVVNDTLKRVENEKLSIVENLGSLRGHYTSLQEQLASCKVLGDEAHKQKESLAMEVKCLREELQQTREERDCQRAHVQALSAEVLKYKGSIGKSFTELDKLMIKCNALQDTCSAQTQQLRTLQCQLTSTNEKLKIADMSAAETILQHEEKNKIIQELQDRLTRAETRVMEGETLRKKLHNTILELKGNIRVFCRVRPLIPDDSAGNDAVIAYPTSTEALGRGIELLQNGGQKYPFTFDKVFSHDASQESVFVEISQLVQSALDGYKVCIFAYGQTGSGKTYTMMGKADAPEQKGMIPRSLEQIFQTSRTLQAQGWKYKLQASVLEIYNETIRDLLVPNKASGLEISRSENVKQYTIKHDANGNTHVSDLTIIDVCSMKEISLLLERAAQSRTVGKTNMNEQSSRSHFVFTLRIDGVNENTEQQVQGVLNLIDLAGSERLSKSGATGDRLKETQAINKSLSSLSDVIFALAKKEDHVPFRNSKLTYLLLPCLGGDSKTLMFVNISPEPSSASESLCSLRFAARVNACEIGIPRRQTALRLPE
ncbi:hypothetical protein MLD38_009996 [Melastoma candidum]|uniref:Uncharacterized protein n=1 Tax=Melastoma candidum TaxID=119954 RepID=A0ACB9QYD5_9MYRT|nr:hypothetical protein MLD38_009996 [Melastoma candidum]